MSSTQCLVQIRTVAVNSLTGLLLAIDEEGRSLLINKQRRTLLHRFSFKGPVAAAAFSPNGRYIACAVGRLLQVQSRQMPESACWTKFTWLSKVSGGR